MTCPWLPEKRSEFGPPSSFEDDSSLLADLLPSIEAALGLEHAAETRAALETKALERVRERSPGLIPPRWP